MGKIFKFGKWVPHELSPKYYPLVRYIRFIVFQIAQKTDFLLKIIIGNEKWIMYDNPKRRHSW